MAMITFAEFEQVEIKAGRVVKVENFPNARKPAYKLWIDFGSDGIKKSSAQITQLYSPADLLERIVLAVTNFPPRQIADFMSEVLVLGVMTAEGGVSLLKTDHDVPLGGRVK